MFALAAGQAGQPPANENKGDPLSALYWLCVIHSNCIIVFLRTGFGREAPGLSGLLSLIVLLLCLGGDPRMILWVAAFLAAIIVQRIITFRAARKGAVIHSRYAGTPLFMKLSLIKKERDAMILEMLFCFVVGAMLLAISHFIGGFMMLGFVTLMIRTGIEDSVVNRRLMRMLDAQIEGSWYSDRMRNNTGRR